MGDFGTPLPESVRFGEQGTRLLSMGGRSVCRSRVIYVLVTVADLSLGRDGGWVHERD